MPSNLKRDSLSPATGSSQLKRVTSHDSINAHPLLSPNSPSSVMPTQDVSTTTPPRYVPYTPRHKLPTSPATTSTTTHASMPVASHRHQEGGATSKLQLQNLKAAAQGIGLGNGTVGWAMLEKLVDGETGAEWDEIWEILMTAKPTLLLPLEPFSGELITPEFIKDHLAFCNSPPLSSSPLITLSGLRGSISDSVLTFRSTFPLASKIFSDVLKPDLRTSILMSLPPIPSPPLSGTNTPLPSFALPAATSLPLPPRFHLSKPPLPPRPGNLTSTPPKGQGGTRITNTFTSLFGRPFTSPAPGTTSTLQPPGTSHAEEGQNVGITDVAAFSIGKKINKKSVGKDLSKVIKEEIKMGLAGCPTWIVDRVLDFTGPLHPVPKISKRINIRQNSSTQSGDVYLNTPLPIPPSAKLLSDPSLLAEAFQSFYISIEDSLRGAALGSPSVGMKKERSAVVQNQDDSSVAERESSGDGKGEPRGNEELDSDARIREIVDRVESVICTVFYDRTFRPLSGDDASHDDALANRIAALSLLDLDLEHLGVEIPNETVRSGVDDVVKSCGESLQELEDPHHRSPKEKSAFLIEAHKKIVDGLSHIPQLHLKSEHDVEDHDHDQKTPRAPSFGNQAAKEAIEEASPSLPVTSVERPLSEDTEAAPAENILNDISALAAQTGSKSISEKSEVGLRTALAHDSIQNSPEALTHASEISKFDAVGLSPRETSPPSLLELPHSDSVSPPSPPPISGDLLFPLLIFSVVKANPPHFVSHLLYTQRFRSRSVGGQESYCLINLMAVVEFLENVDMGALGLGDSERVMSTADLTPIQLAHGSIDSNTSPPSPLSSRLGRRMNQQVEELAGLAGSANKVITGVVDSSFGVLRGLLTSNPDITTPHSETEYVAPWNNMRPAFGLLRRASGFSIASVTASLPAAGRPKTLVGGLGDEGQQLIEVSSRSGSIKVQMEAQDEEAQESMSEETVDSEDSPDSDVPDRGDARSIRSFSSMMSRESRDRDRVGGEGRMSLTDRFASISATRLGPSSGEYQAVKASPPSRPTSRPTSWLPTTTLVAPQSVTPASFGTSSPPHPKIRIPPPNRRFLECSEQDIRVGEVGELLREYRRMVEALHTLGALEDIV